MPRPVLTAVLRQIHVAGIGLLSYIPPDVQQGVSVVREIGMQLLQSPCPFHAQMLTLESSGFGLSPALKAGLALTL